MIVGLLLVDVEMSVYENYHYTKYLVENNKTSVISTKQLSEHCRAEIWIFFLFMYFIVFMSCIIANYNIFASLSSPISSKYLMYPYIS